MSAGHSLSFQTDNDPSTDGNQGSKLFADNLTFAKPINSSPVSSCWWWLSTARH